MHPILAESAPHRGRAIALAAAALAAVVSLTFAVHARSMHHVRGHHWSHHLGRCSAPSDSLVR
jgi:hypothetical protein